MHIQLAKYKSFPGKGVLPPCNPAWSQPPGPCKHLALQFSTVFSLCQQSVLEPLSSPMLKIFLNRCWGPCVSSWPSSLAKLNPALTENFDNSPQPYDTPKFRFIFVKRCVIGLVYIDYIQPSVAKNGLEQGGGGCNNPFSEARVNRYGIVLKISLIIA